MRDHNLSAYKWGHCAKQKVLFERGHACAHSITRGRNHPFVSPVLNSLNRNLSMLGNKAFCMCVVKNRGETYSSYQYQVTFSRIFLGKIPPKTPFCQQIYHSCGWHCQLQGGFTFQFTRLKWKSTVHSCTTSCSQLPRLPTCLGCLLLNIDRHLEHHSSTINLWRSSEVGPALSSVCRTRADAHTDRRTCTWTHLVFGIGAMQGLGKKNWAPWKLAAVSKAQCFGK